MQICPHCGKENFEGVIFCDRCGVALVAVPLATRQLSQADDRGSGDSLGSDNILIIQVESQDNPITIQVKHEIILGRVSDTSDTTTYINLTPFGGDLRGVSRRHARLLREGSAVYLMDLNSTNGTRLNGESLAAGVEKRLRDGDEIAVGKLRLYVFFKP
jgi:pSer/pThr/pTyr-binding forkhead associated (FHA) protein